MTDRRSDVRTEKSFCRFCHALCGIEVDIAGGKAIAVRGDPGHPISRGFMCVKGKQLINQHYADRRLLGTLKRRANGRFDPVPSEQGIDEAAEKLSRIIERHGPRSVALYNGTKSWGNVAHGLARSWLDGIGSPSFYTTVTIDQPAKLVAAALHGRWEAGHHDIASSDVAMFVGSNPLRSFLQENLKLPCANANRYLSDLVADGLKLIVIDPRRSESAQKAVLHLAIKPGEDPTLLAGIIRVVIENGWYDREFVDANATGLDKMREAVAPFVLNYVAERTGVAGEQIVEAARIFGQGRRGGAVAGTGPNMALYPLATELLVCALNTLCGRYRQAGETLGHTGVLGPRYEVRAQSSGPYPFDGYLPAPRVKGLRSFFFEQPSAALADEILTPGDGQVRALICHGGNPAVAFPDQQKTVRALEELDLLVCLDVHMTPTARLADYVFGCRLSLEKADYTRHLEWYFPEPFAQTTPALLDSPGDVIDEWEFFWGLANRMRIPLSLGRVPMGPPVEGRPVDIDVKPSTEELMRLEAADSNIPLDEVGEDRAGRLFESARSTVGLRDPDSAGRFDLAPDELIRDLREVRAESRISGDISSSYGNFSHRLISRRMLQVFNSTGTHLAKLNRSGPGNPAFMNPDDMQDLRIDEGSPIEIASDHGRIRAWARAEAGIPSGVVSMAHAWGHLPSDDEGEADPAEGVCTNALVAGDRDYEPLTGMCRMSAIPVNIRAL